MEHSYTLELFLLLLIHLHGLGKQAHGHPTCSRPIPAAELERYLCLIPLDCWNKFRADIEERGVASNKTSYIGVVRLNEGVESARVGYDLRDDMGFAQWSRWLSRNTRDSRNNNMNGVPLTRVKLVVSEPFSQTE
jgi:hypothetical protein